MCGIAGWIGNPCADAQVVAGAMADTLRHRGPDDEGRWIKDDSRVALAHRRLSVIDLSAAGHQPMESHCGRFVLALNGEIYNHLALRRELERSSDAPPWRGHSDTESLLAAISAWGFDAALEAAVGMYAIALWDKQERSLTLARDRAGEKPLYYGWQNGTCLFGSELKALRAHPDFTADIDRDALTLYLRYSSVPAPYSIYSGIRKLRPGHKITIELDVAPEQARPVPYWNINDVARRGIANPFNGDDEDAYDEVSRILSNSIKGQMMSDVPLGAFLSGGIDSSCVVALMQANSGVPVRTFTIGFESEHHDEAAQAQAVAQHLGTDHTELTVTPNDALGLISSLPSTYCEPFSDSSQIPTMLISKLARQSVTVALTGDGGDEVFGGYNRYLAGKRMWERTHRLPGVLRNAVARALTGVSPMTWDRLAAAANPILPRAARITTPGDKAQKLGDALRASGGLDAYCRLRSLFKAPEEVVVDGAEPASLFDLAEMDEELDCLEHTMMLLDTKTYLPDDVLVKVDRASMAYSLESRVPILDHRLIEFAWTLPIDKKIRDGAGKRPLRAILDRHVPRELTERPKAGFTVPLDAWLRGPLRDWCDDLLSEQRIRNDGYFVAAPVRKMWEEHLAGAHNWQHHLWSVLMFQVWLEQNSARNPR